MNFSIWVYEGTLPLHLHQHADGQFLVVYQATAVDVVDGAVAVTCSPASGSTFAMGTTAVNCSATDNQGNSATGSFSVVVLTPVQIVTNLLARTMDDQFDDGSALQLKNGFRYVDSTQQRQTMDKFFSKASGEKK